MSVLTTLRSRRTVVPLLLLGAVALGAAPASAAGASLTLDSDVVSVSDPVAATGTCDAAEATSAVLTVSQGGSTLDEQAVDLEADGTFEAELSVEDGETGPAVVAVDCLAYGTADPVGSAQADLLVVDAGFFDDVEVTVNPTTVAIGGSITISAPCAAGTSTASVQAGNSDADEPFLDREVTPAADGAITLTAPVVAGGGVTPQAGDAVAVVICGDLQDLPDGGPIAVGIADFMITEAVAAPMAPAAAVPSAPELARTGASSTDLALTAALLLLAGCTAIKVSRRD